MSEIFNIVLLKPNQPSIIYKFGDVKKGKSLKKKTNTISDLQG